MKFLSQWRYFSAYFVSYGLYNQPADDENKGDKRIVASNWCINGVGGNPQITYVYRVVIWAKYGSSGFYPRIFQVLLGYGSARSAEALSPDHSRPVDRIFCTVYNGNEANRI